MSSRRSGSCEFCRHRRSRNGADQNDCSFDAALRYKLVKPVPSRAGPASDDIEPATLLFPPDYHTRSELRKIQEQNEASRQLLHKHSALNAERHAQLSCVLSSSQAAFADPRRSSQLAALTKRISESQSLLDNLDPIMAAADADVTDSTQLVRSLAGLFDSANSLAVAEELHQRSSTASTSRLSPRPSTSHLLAAVPHLAHPNNPISLLRLVLPPLFPRLPQSDNVLLPTSSS